MVKLEMCLSLCVTAQCACNQTDMIIVDIQLISTLIGFEVLPLHTVRIRSIPVLYN
jgi:hypothetical protein